MDDDDDEQPQGVVDDDEELQDVEVFFKEDFSCIDCNKKLAAITDCYPESERKDGLIFRCLACYNKQVIIIIISVIVMITTIKIRIQLS